MGTARFRLAAVRSLAAVIVLALGGCASQATAPSAAVSPSATPSDEPMTATPIPTASPVESPSPSSHDNGTAQSPADGWVEVASFGSDTTIEAVYDVVEAPFGLVAAGVHMTTRDLAVFGPLPGEGRIWLSADGTSWEDATPADAFASAVIHQLIVLADGAVLARGLVDEVVDGIPVERPGAWETRDGRAWTEVNLRAGDDPVYRIAVGGRGYLALASVELGGPQLWYSSDGRTFSPVADPTGGRIVTRMAAGPEGFVIGAEVYESAERPTVYASGDGLDWHEATDPGWAFGEVAPIGPDWIAVDSRAFDDTADGEVPTWRSANGLEWSQAGRLPLRAIPAGGDAACVEFPSLVTTGSLVVASTALSYPCAEGRVQRFGGAHVTSDGKSWLPLPFATGADFDESTRGTWIGSGLDLDSGTLLVGEKEHRATFWFRPND